jgi:outer membrane protein assembly factor BamA
MMIPFGRKWSLIILLILWCSVFPVSRSEAQVSIDSEALLSQPLAGIQISGNIVTREEIILREMETKVGNFPSKGFLRRDQLRLKGLNLFSRVEFRLVGSVNGTTLMITVTELWYILPLPYWYFKDQDPQKLVYGFRFHQRNFRGRNESLILDFWNGADRGFRFTHTNPWIRYSPELSRSVELFQVTRNSRREGVSGLEERATHVGLGVGKRWTMQLVSNITARFQLVTASDPRQLASRGALDRIFETTTVTYWDSRDLVTFPMEGFYLQGGYIRGWILNNGRHYDRLNLDARAYLPMHERMSLYARLKWAPGWGSVPPYDWFYINGTGPLRTTGVTAEGRSLYLGGLEARMMLTDLHYFTWKQAPLFAQYFRNLEYGLGAEVFVEAGDAYQNAKDTGLDSLMMGYGVGLLLRLPYVQVMRLEYCLNPKHSPKEASFSINMNVAF